MRHTRFAALVPVALAVLAACGDGGGDARSANPADGPAEATILLADVAFSPAAVTVPTGGTVAWRWDDGPIPHDVVFDDGPASPKQDDGTWERTFDQPGTYEYVCSLHPGMTGTVVVR